MIWVLGSGAFGTALAISLSRDAPVTLWSRHGAHAEQMAQDHENAKHLPNHKFPDALHVTADLSTLPDHAPCLLAVPMQHLRALLTEHRKTLANRPLIACCKGIELTTGLGPSKIIAEIVPSAEPAILTGPSFADDIAKSLPTALTLACANPEVGTALQEQLHAPNLRIYRTDDITGAELGGALKNVIAIACGASMGATLGDSARAALMTRGFAEMQRIATHMGAQPDTLTGLSGFGDLVLTCSSALSRNYRYGLSIGSGSAFDTTSTVEGVATAEATLEIARKNGIDAPITESVVALSNGRIKVEEALILLLNRPLKEE